VRNRPRPLKRLFPRLPQLVSEMKQAAARNPKFRESAGALIG